MMLQDGVFSTYSKEAFSLVFLKNTASSLSSAQSAWWLCTDSLKIHIVMFAVLPQIGHRSPWVTGLYVLVSLVFSLSAVIGENCNFMGQKLSKLVL